MYEWEYFYKEKFPVISNLDIPQKSTQERQTKCLILSLVCFQNNELVPYHPQVCDELRSGHLSLQNKQADVGNLRRHHFILSRGFVARACGQGSAERPLAPCGTD